MESTAAVCYVEFRRQHTPVAIVLRELEAVSPLTISLPQLQQTHAHSPPRPLWRKGRPPYRKDWTPQFRAGAEARVFAARDPGDELSGKAAKGRLVVTFNPEAVAEFGRVLREAAGADAPPWELVSLQLSLIGNSPLLHVVSVFRPVNSPNPTRFEVESNTLNRLNDQFWPVFLAVVEETRRRTPAKLWTGAGMPFGLPPSFLASGHPDFDPSAEYHFESHLFVRGTDGDLEAWRQHAVPGRQDVLQKPSRNGAIVRVSWGTTVWELPPSMPAPSEEALVEDVLSTALASDQLKVITFRDRLYAALLDDAQSGRAAVPADELRDVIYRDHALWQSLSQRGRSLSEFDRHYYQVARRVYETDEHIDSVRHLGVLVIHLAEGLESDTALRAERRLQRIALVLSIVALGALLMDGWNFVLGAPSEPIALESARLRTMFGGVLLLTLAVLALLLSKLVIGARTARPKPR